MRLPACARGGSAAPPSWWCRAEGGGGRVNPSVNAIVTVVPDIARWRAAAADERLRRGEPAGPLDGLPVAHKDLVSPPASGRPWALRSTRTGSPRSPRSSSSGSRRQARSPSARRTRPSSGPAPRRSIQVFGATRNPYDLSNGPAAARAAAPRSRSRAGWCRSPMAATSAARCATPPRSATSSGSAPHPAACRSGRASSPWSPLSVDGPMARTVADVALLLSGDRGPGRALPALALRAGRDRSQPARARRRPEPGRLEPRRRRSSGRARGAAALARSGGARRPRLRDRRRLFPICRTRGRLPHFAPSASSESRLRRTTSRATELKETIRWNIELARRQTAAEVATAMRAHAELVERRSPVHGRGRRPRAARVAR